MIAVRVMVLATVAAMGAALQSGCSVEQKLERVRETMRRTVISLGTVKMNNASWTEYAVLVGPREAMIMPDNLEPGQSLTVALPDGTECTATAGERTRPGVLQRLVLDRDAPDYAPIAPREKLRGIGVSFYNGSEPKRFFTRRIKGVRSGVLRFEGTESANVPVFTLEGEFVGMVYYLDLLGKEPDSWVAYAGKR
jgi:hypothetical protein